MTSLADGLYGIGIVESSMTLKGILDARMPSTSGFNFAFGQ